MCSCAQALRLCSALGTHAYPNLLRLTPTRSEAEGKKIHAELAREYGKNVLFIKCDVANEAEIKDLIDGTVKAFGKLDCLINNAVRWLFVYQISVSECVQGVHPPHQSIDSFSVADFQKLLNINIVSMFAACKYALHSMRSCSCPDRDALMF